MRKLINLILGIVLLILVFRIAKVVLKLLFLAIIVFLIYDAVKKS
ncbi:hypothetical protein [Clostridium omnivorum]|uniref:Uncharacterized protein n=1 Tax=Clostridium omnivorum TaxID=1604902 RepID=A0ABQ5N4H3_9CLOT|nr:hypothetical protein [Clostridium sp. E14]GLC30112.1 hypothetical protein bsdE14_15220 [Clostridium sp. E14]